MYDTDQMLKPRVAICLEYPITQLGGIEILVSELVRGLSDVFSFVLVSTDETSQIMAGVWKNFVTYHVRVQGPGSLVQPQSLPLRFRELKVNAQSLALRLRELKVDMAHFHADGAYGWGSRWAESCPIFHCCRLGIPCLITNHGPDPVLAFCGKHHPFWFKIGCLPLAWINRLRVLDLVESEITVSKCDLRCMRRRFFPAARKLRQIYHATSCPDLPERPEGREPLILSVAVICKNKGQVDLVNAFGSIAHRFPEWRLMLVGRRAWGEQDSFAEVLATIERHGIKNRVVMPGAFQREDVFGLMQRASIFAMPSYSEALGLALQEALHYGCPAIGYAVGGIPELIDHEENGLLVPCGNIRALQDGLQQLMSDTHLRRELGQNAKDSINKKGMNVTAMNALHRTLYWEIVSKHSRKMPSKQYR